MSIVSCFFLSPETCAALRLLHLHTHLFSLLKKIEKWVRIRLSIAWFLLCVSPSSPLSPLQLPFRVMSTRMLYLVPELQVRGGSFRLSNVSWWKHQTVQYEIRVTISTNEFLCTACPVDFEHQNYTVFKKCKSPYSVELCCSALVEFTCPFVDYVDDLTTDCAQVMFDTINVREGYPPALFASLCKEGKEGLACPAPPQAPPSMAAAAAVKNVESCGGSIICELFIVIMLVFSMIM